MQRIIQINIASRQIPIEEDAYLQLRDYLLALNRQFQNEDGKEEIIQDIENRIAELFDIRLQNGALAIDVADVRKVVDTLGTPSAVSGNSTPVSSSINLKKTPPPISYSTNTQQQTNSQTASNTSDMNTTTATRRIFRNPNDKMVGGVCSGIGNYFDIDPLIIRLIWGAAALIGVGVLTYFIAWALIPVAKSPQDFSRMTNGNAMTFHDVSRNVAGELEDLKKRGEQMSRELKAFFSKKK